MQLEVGGYSGARRCDLCDGHPRSGRGDDHGGAHRHYESWDFVQIGEPEEIYEHPTTRDNVLNLSVRLMSLKVYSKSVMKMAWSHLLGLVHPLKVDVDASVVDNVPVHVALRPEKNHALRGTSR